jgi:uncharacterized membrane protein
MWALRLFCQPVSHLALSLHGALLPVVASVVLIGILLPGKWDVLVLVLITAVVSFIAFLISDVNSDRGIDTKALTLGLISGLLAQLFMFIRVVGGRAANHVEWNPAIRLLGPPISALALKPIVFGYFAAVFGTLIGADLLHLCSLVKDTEVVRIGGAGFMDGIFLAGPFSIVTSLAGSFLWLTVVSSSQSDNHTY